jgi:glyoxylase-like metal-dependent hydrolase (beta-lactamase superfamily II)
MRLGLFSIAALVAVTGPAAAQSPDFSKVEVKTEVIAPGVAVLFGAGGNIGVSYGEDGTALVDDQYAPMTDKIVAAVAALGAKPVRFLVNTHWHGDHSGGNENFGKAGAVIMAHDNVRVRLLQGGTSGAGTSGARNITPAASLALPVVTYDHGLKLHLNGDVIEAIFTGGGHTDGDSALYWRKANVLHTGDLMMNGLGFPFIDTRSGGNATQLVQTLTKLIALTNAETKIIPGHGPVGKQADLIAWRDMIAKSIELIRQRKATGQKLEAVLADNPLKPMEKPKAFISADAFVKAIWASLDATGGKPHKH